MALVFSLIVMIAFFLMFFMIYRTSESVLESNIESSTLDSMSQYASFVSSTMTQIDDLAGTVLDSDFTRQWSVTQSNPKLTSSDKVLSDRVLSQNLTYFANNYPMISAISVYRESGLLVGENDHIVLHSSLRDEPWYAAYRYKDIHWIPIFDAKNKPYQSGNLLSFIVPLGTFEPSTAHGLIKLDVDASVFEKPLKTIRLGSTANTFLLDDTGHSMLSVLPHSSALQQKVDSIVNGQSNEGIDGISFEGKRSELIYKRLSSNGWIVLSIIPYAAMFGKLTSLKYTILFITAAVLLLTIGAAVVLSVGITKPLSKLVNAMRYLKEGEFSSVERQLNVDNPNRDEIHFVMNSFVQMSRDLQQRIRNEIELTALRKRAEYRALIMQINPHFLFNTLEVLSSLAMQKRTDEVVDSIASLGKMLRFSLNTHDERIAVQEELKYIHEYVSLLRIRFRDRLCISVDSECDLENVKVIKFLLQPLIENAVKYSLKAREIAHVKVRIWLRNGCLFVSVKDNGDGFDPHLVDELYKMLSSEQVTNVLQSGTHIGLRNVLARCYLYYGREFTLNIDSKRELGTYITLSFQNKY